MNRLQKKCFFASAGFHLLLVLILLIGPAFLSSSSRTENVPMIEFVPINTTDANISGGGNPKGALPQPVTQPQPAVTQPAPIAVAEKPPTPEPPPKEKVKEVTPPKDNPESLEAATKPKPKNSQISTNLITRKPDLEAAAKARAAAAAKATAERNRRIAAAFNNAALNISKNTSGSTPIDDFKGTGGGGVPYGNWNQAVKKTYTDAWIVPDGVTDDSATVTATVTIARDGEVLSTSVTRYSGNSIVDHSVKATLDRVRYAPKLPEGAREDKRTITIIFDVKAKQTLG